MHSLACSAVEPNHTRQLAHSVHSKHELVWHEFQLAQSLAYNAAQEFYRSLLVHEAP